MSGKCFKQCLVSNTRAIPYYRELTQFPALRHSTRSLDFPKGAYFRINFDQLLGYDYQMIGYQKTV